MAEVCDGDEAVVAFILDFDVMVSDIYVAIAVAAAEPSQCCWTSLISCVLRFVFCFWYLLSSLSSACAAAMFMNTYIMEVVEACKAENGALSDERAALPFPRSRRFTKGYFTVQCLSSPFESPRNEISSEQISCQLFGKNV